MISKTIIKSSQNIIWFKGIMGSWFYIFSKKNTFLLNEQLVQLYKSKLNNFYLKSTLNNLATFDKNLVLFFQKIVTGTAVGFKKIILIRARASKLKIRKHLVVIKSTLPYLVRTKFCSYMKLAKFKKITNKGIFRRQEILPTLKIRSKSLNIINQWTSRLRKRNLPNFYTGCGIRYLNDIIPDRRDHFFKLKQRAEAKGKKRKRKKKKPKYKWAVLDN